jgi:hypothetical protein
MYSIIHELHTAMILRKLLLVTMSGILGIKLVQHSFNITLYSFVDSALSKSAGYYYAIDTYLDSDVSYTQIYKGGLSMQGYCMKCKAKREMSNVKAVKMKNGKPASTGTCPKCGTKMYRIGKSK